jgi:hypothetical protein
MIHSLHHFSQFSHVSEIQFREAGNTRRAVISVITRFNL